MYVHMQYVRMWTRHMSCRGGRLILCSQQRIPNCIMATYILLLTVLDLLLLFLANTHLHVIPCTFSSCLVRQLKWL